MSLYSSSKSAAVIDCDEKIEELNEEIARLKGENKHLLTVLDDFLHDGDTEAIRTLAEKALAAAKEGE